jgi:hypothetical protein
MSLLALALWGCIRGQMAALEPKKYGIHAGNQDVQFNCSAICG